MLRDRKEWKGTERVGEGGWLSVLTNSVHWHIIDSIDAKKTLLLYIKTSNYKHIQIYFVVHCKYKYIIMDKH